MTWDIIEIVSTNISKKYGITLEDLRGKDTGKMLSKARRECYRFLISKNVTYEKIGDYFHRSASTIHQFVNSARHKEQRRNRRTKKDLRQAEINKRLREVFN